MLRLEVVARDAFHASVNAASEAITRAGGWVSGHSLLSDAMAVLSFEIPGDRLRELVDELEARGLKTELPSELSSSPKDVAGRLTLFLPRGCRAVGWKSEKERRERPDRGHAQLMRPAVTAPAVPFASAAMPMPERLPRQSLRHVAWVDSSKPP